MKKPSQRRKPSKPKYFVEAEYYPVHGSWSYAVRKHLFWCFSSVVEYSHLRSHAERRAKYLNDLESGVKPTILITYLVDKWNNPKGLVLTLPGGKRRTLKQIEDYENILKELGYQVECGYEMD